MKPFYILCASLFFCSYTYGFGATGHRITGEIAEQFLTKKAKRAVKQIIGTESLAEASTYADTMRANPSPFWQEEANPYHYVTVPEGKSYIAVGAPPKGDAYTALKQFRATLQDPRATKADKALALRFTIHIIGDLHQPLHAGNGKDRGGNDVTVVFFGEKTNLHRVWDWGLIDRQRLSFTEWSQWLIKTIDKQDINEWRSTDPLVWIDESASIRDTIYPENRKISWDYEYQHLPTVKLRLKQAGVRLALYLNEIYK